MDQQKKIIVGAIIATVVLVGGIVYFTTRGPSCKLVETLDAKAVPVVLASKDKSALVSFLGSLEYAIDDKGTKAIHMPLTASKVEVEKDKDGKVTKEVKLSADCATLTFNLGTPTTGGYSVDSIAVDIVKANKGASSCKITGLGITYKADEYYSCQKGSYKCLDDKANLIATLNIIDLKLETERDSKAKDGDFAPKTVNQCK